MDKLRMQTLDGVQDNIDKIAALFPNCITERKDTEGKVSLAIDFDKLRQELSSEIVEGREERYQFTWPDKKKAILLANSPINATLRPCREESVDFDNTQNLYIEGDNLDVLKCLKETYLGKVKMIYIDPPYNTGNDFVYEDDFAESTAEYLANSGQYDEQGNRLVTNSESNGRFHTDWLNMIYPRLKVVRELLSEDGVIFISIDDNEVENLKKVCNEIFGESNFVADIVWKHTQQSKNDELHFSRQYNHTLSYSKSKELLPEFYFVRTDEDNVNYKNPDNDPKGLWRNGDVRSPNYRKTLCFDIIAPNGNIIKAPSNGWRWSENNLKEKMLTGEVKFKDDYSGIIRKIYLSDQKGRTPENLWEGQRYGTTRQAAATIKELFDGKQVFDTPKPYELIMRMLEIASNKDSVILDFFSGSATTAHAVMQLNAEDGGNRKFIMVQLPELTYESKMEKYKDGDIEKEWYIIDETTKHPIIIKDSEARKAGYWTICEIGKERIRRAGKKIKEELAVKQQESGLFTKQEEKQTIDIGFRVLKLDSSNMEDIYYSPAEYNQQTLFTKTESVKSDRTSEDLLFQVMLELGATLDSKIEQIEIEGKTIYNVANNYLIACFDNEINDSVVTAIAKMQPQYAVFRDSSMADDSTVTNFEQIFKTYSPNTTTKVL
ncbi:site-specific DNA-methyltransferase [Bacteroides ovatus]|uniref:site-specific DNA-methyltransferase n=1 Tax=Bacteroides ovatus TaxID=28116 RepID=UPI001F4435DA|nr:site-specific DNA-methyltransferase [Bacteroides ovatus]MCE8921302.1 site-specific DNA-methyltransferase [Bacteroides ovatus]